MLLACAATLSTHPTSAYKLHPHLGHTFTEFLVSASSSREPLQGAAARAGTSVTGGQLEELPPASSQVGASAGPSTAGHEENQRANAAQNSQVGHYVPAVSAASVQGAAGGDEAARAATKPVAPEHTRGSADTQKASSTDKRQSICSTPSVKPRTQPSHTAQSPFMAQLCDFGAAFAGTMPASLLSAQTSPAQQRTTHAKTPCGTDNFCAPEVAFLSSARAAPSEVTSAAWPAHVRSAAAEAFKNGYNPFAADVWSFGVTLFKVVAGRKPFHRAAITDGHFRGFVMATQPRLLHEAILNKESSLWTRDTPSWEWPSRFSPALRGLIGSCLQVRPDDRPTVAALLKHPWFKSPNPPRQSVTLPAGQSVPPVETSARSQPALGGCAEAAAPPGGARSSQPSPRASNEHAPLAVATGLRSGTGTGIAVPEQAAHPRAASAAAAAEPGASLPPLPRAKRGGSTRHGCTVSTGKGLGIARFPSGGGWCPAEGSPTNPRLQSPHSHEQSSEPQAVRLSREVDAVQAFAGAGSLESGLTRELSPSGVPVGWGAARTGSEPQSAAMETAAGGTASMVVIVSVAAEH